MASKINWIHLIIVAFLISRKIFSACGKSMNGDMATQASLRTARSAAAEWDNYRLLFPRRHGERIPLQKYLDSLGHEFRAEDATESLHQYKREAKRVSDADLLQALLDELQGSKDRPKKHKKRRKKKKKKKSSQYRKVKQ